MQPVMRIADGPAETMHPLNVGLMFFDPAPQKFFPQTQIDVVWFPDGSGGDTFTEQTFVGPFGRDPQRRVDIF
jgi:ATP-dependent DNA helicase RecG